MAGARPAGYDAIVVGAGAAGCVLAARLSEDPGRAVLLLEAGPDYPDPAALPPEIASAGSPAYTHDWGYYSEPGLLGRAIHLPRGRLVGGSSATNATVALRGATPADYDGWAAQGNPGWAFADVLPFFRRLERDAEGDDAWHGRDGPVPIRRAPPEEWTPLQRAFVDACTALGYPRMDDHNAPGALGVGPVPRNEAGGMRQSAALAYLQPARSRPNLTVRADAPVDRVVFAGRRAVGVRLAGDGQTIEAERVVLAAGAYGSPAILLRSGLGPAAELRALGIAVLEDLPGVGRDLADHPLLGLVFASPAPTADVPWLQLLLTWRSGGAAAGYDVQIVPAGPWPSEAGSIFRLFVSLVEPRSRGRLRLRSADPAAAPLIDLGYFAHPDDLPRMIEAVRLARRIAWTAPLAGLAPHELFPGPGVPDGDAELAAAVRAEVETYHHAVGTCRMGPAADGLAVVDARGNVHAVDGLAVADASIMPAIPAGNTHVPTLMVAERCAAWLAE